MERGEIVTNRIYNNVMRLIEEQRLTKAKVEKGAGLGNGTIESWKDGNPTIEKLEAVSNVLGCTVTDLIKEVS